MPRQPVKQSAGWRNVPVVRASSSSHGSRWDPDLAADARTPHRHDEHRPSTDGCDRAAGRATAWTLVALTDDRGRRGVSGRLRLPARKPALALEGGQAVGSPEMKSSMTTASRRRDLL